MKKKPSHGPTQNWRNVPEHDFFLVAKSFHTAARKLVETLNPVPGPLADFDICPVLSMYRRALEMQLKVIILGDGGNFLAARPDELSVHKSRSVSWLSQFVCQIITILKWEKEFRCEGIENLTDFKDVVEEVNAIDPGFHAFRHPADFNVREFAAKMEALLDMLESTADGLAATWDMQMKDAAPDTALDGSDFKETIH
jgi:hypothetical protein